jgi:hypothetical protein
VGQEVPTRVTWKRATSEGRAQLETDYLLFRGDFRLKLPFADIKKVSTRSGSLLLDSTQGKVTLELGTRAEKWAEKILHPPSVLDKLGVKEGQMVSVLGSAPSSFVDELTSRVGGPVSFRARKDSDLIFLFSNDRSLGSKMAKLVGSLQPAGAIWVVYPKGRKELTENDVLGAGRDAGLKDVKVAKFSDTHTALKFVIPLASR